MKKDKQIIWIFGGSGSGKNRFTQFITKYPSHQLLTRLGWSSKKIIVSEESLLWVGKNIYDPIIKKRKELPEIISSLINMNNDIVLVKGQDYDIRELLPQKTKELLPNYTHKIIYLHTPADIAFARWNERPWKKFWYSKHTTKKFLKITIQHIQTLTNDFPVLALDSTNDEYLEINFPPSI